MIPLMARLDRLASWPKEIIRLAPLLAASFPTRLRCYAVAYPSDSVANDF